jgi:Ca-activated chloride channel family protein
MLTLKLRYKLPEATDSALLAFALTDGGQSFEAASTDFRFAASVAAFGMLLRDSPHKGDTSYDKVLEMATSARGDDQEGYRQEFLSLVQQAEAVGSRP